MGKISEYLIELTEKFQDLLWNRGTWHEAVDDMKKILSEDEFKFFLAHFDIIQEMIHGQEEETERGLQNLDKDNWDSEGNMIPGYEDLDEASGVKGDVLRPYGGRRARANMGLRKGNRANYDPKEELDTDDDTKTENVYKRTWTD